MKSQRRKITERVAAFLTLLLATALMTYAASSSAATPATPARPARAIGAGRAYHARHDRRERELPRDTVG